MKDAIRSYFDCWLRKDITPIDSLFADNIVYTECYGPVYTGIGQLRSWFHDWNTRGRVIRWDIKRIIEHENTIVAEWYFECEYDGGTDDFDGVTIAVFDRHGKICELKEFQSKAEHYYPYG